MGVRGQILRFPSAYLFDHSASHQFSKVNNFVCAKEHMPGTAYTQGHCIISLVSPSGQDIKHKHMDFLSFWLGSSFPKGTSGQTLLVELELHSPVSLHVAVKYHRRK